MTESPTDPTWKKLIYEELHQPNGILLRKRLLDAEKNGVIIYPPKENWFKAFRLTPFEEVKVVIVGQDPYHEPGQAEGMSFSVPSNVPIPPSLRNIFKELSNTVPNFKFPTSGSLDGWAKQGVLLLNRVLTVQKGMARSHHGWGWEAVVLHLLQALVAEREKIVFLLWGNDAISLRNELDLSRQFVLTTTHPSPLSANRGFLGSNCFVKANELLVSVGKSPIDWAKTN